MRFVRSASVALILAVAGCSGGGSTRTTPVLPPNSTQSGTAKLPLSISIPRRPSSSTSARRSPRYVSPAAYTFALYDGATLVYDGYFASEASPPQFVTVYASSGPTTATAGTCSGTTTLTCGFVVTASVGTHSFDIVTYPIVDASDSVERVPLDTAPPTFSGTILSEGELTVDLAAGDNPGKTLTLLGAAAETDFFGPDVLPAGESTEISYIVKDAAGYQIIQPGNYDNGPVTITASPPGDVTMTPISQTAGPSATGAQTFDVTCTSVGANITFTAAANSHPNATYASGLTYSGANYPSGTLGSITLTCEGT